VFHNIVTNVGSMFFAVPFVHPNGVWWMEKWDTICINVIGKSWENDLDLVLQARSKHMPSSWMSNVILVDNAQAEINVLKFDFPKSTYYDSMFINCVL
jgi:hypothetical protein